MILKRNILQNTAADNESGSIIVMALMVLAIMTVIGLMAADTVVTENMILRNTGIRKQNKNLVESAVMEGLQDVIQIDAGNPANFDPGSNLWINNDDQWESAGTLTNWYNPMTAGILDNTNSVVPDMVLNDNADSISILQTRGEDDTGSLRIAVVGWESAPGASLKATGPTRKSGRILAEYISTDAGGDDNGYGIIRMEIGVERVF